MRAPGNYFNTLNAGVEGLGVFRGTGFYFGGCESETIQIGEEITQGGRWEVFVNATYTRDGRVSTVAGSVEFVRFTTPDPALASAYITQIGGVQLTASSTEYIAYIDRLYWDLDTLLEFSGGGIGFVRLTGSTANITAFQPPNGSLDTVGVENLLAGVTERSYSGSFVADFLYFSLSPDPSPDPYLVIDEGACSVSWTHGLVLHERVYQAISYFSDPFSFDGPTPGRPFWGANYPYKDAPSTDHRCDGGTLTYDSPTPLPSNVTEIVEVESLTGDASVVRSELVVNSGTSGAAAYALQTSHQVVMNDPVCQFFPCGERDDINTGPLCVFKATRCEPESSVSAPSEVGYTKDAWERRPPGANRILVIVPDQNGNPVPVCYTPTEESGVGLGTVYGASSFTRLAVVDWIEAECESPDCTGEFLIAVPCDGQGPELGVSQTLFDSRPPDAQTLFKDDAGTIRCYTVKVSDQSLPPDLDLAWHDAGCMDPPCFDPPDPEFFVGNACVGSRTIVVDVAPAGASPGAGWVLMAVRNDGVSAQKCYKVSDVPTTGPADPRYTARWVFNGCNSTVCRGGPDPEPPVVPDRPIIQQPEAQGPGDPGAARPSENPPNGGGRGNIPDDLIQGAVFRRCRGCGN